MSDNDNSNNNNDSNSNNDSTNNNDSNNNNHQNKTNHTKNNCTKYVTRAIKGYHMVDWYIISFFTISYIYIIIKILAYAFTFIQMRRELQGSC